MAAKYPQDSKDTKDSKDSSEENTFFCNICFASVKEADYIKYEGEHHKNCGLCKVKKLIFSSNFILFSIFYVSCRTKQ